MGGVRNLLRQAFDELWIVDLGGEGRGALKEENVFDIQTPVAIAVGVRIGAESSDDCVVRYLRFEGDRAAKFARLRRMKLGKRFERVSGDALDRLVPLSTHEYHDWPEITELFPWIRSGCKLGRTWPIAESKAVLRRRWRELTSRVPRRRPGAFVETKSGKKSDTEPRPLLSASGKLRSIRRLKADAAPEGYERYGYRTLDRQWVIADERLIDRAGPVLWHLRSRQQVFLTTLTSTKLGSGPVLTVSPYVPDLDHFSGRGAKNVMPLYLDVKAERVNVTDGVLDVLSESLGGSLTAEALLAYVYGLGGTPAFSERFSGQLAEAAGPVRLPMTSDPTLFDEAVVLGWDLLWWHTWGERFAPEPNAKLPEGRATEVVAVSGMPEDFRYDPESDELVVGNGVVAPVSSEVWDFEVSGLKVLQSWLDYRMKNRRRNTSSELDDIRPTRWTQSKELLLLLSILEHTVEVTPRAADLLDRIVNGPLISAADLPTPTPAERKPPRHP